MPLPSRLIRAVIGLGVVAILFVLFHLSWSWIVVLLLAAAIFLLWPVAWRTAAILLVTVALLLLAPLGWHWFLHEIASKSQAANAITSAPAVAPSTEQASTVPATAPTTSPSPATTTVAPPPATSAPPVQVTSVPADSMSFFQLMDDGSIKYLGTGIQHAGQAIDQGDTFPVGWRSAPGQLTINLSPKASLYGVWTTDGTHSQPASASLVTTSDGTNQVVVNMPSGSVIAVAFVRGTWQDANVGNWYLTTGNGIHQAYEQVIHNAKAVTVSDSPPTSG